MGVPFIPFYSSFIPFIPSQSKPLEQYVGEFCRLSLTNKFVDNTGTCCLFGRIRQLGNLLEGGAVPGTLAKLDIASAIQTESGYTLKESKELR